MLTWNRDTKVGRYWDYDQKNKNKIVNDEIRMITEYQKMAFQQVLNGTWSEEEYNHFSSEIKQVYIYHFVSFIDLYKSVFNIAYPEMLKELSNLLNNKVLRPSLNYKSIPQLIARADRDLQSRLMSFSKMPFIEEEKGPYNSDEEKLEIYQRILKELKNPDSDYNQLFQMALVAWVEENIKNDELKNVILANADILLQMKIASVKQIIKSIPSTAEKYAMEVDYYFTAQKSETVRKKALKQKNR